MASRRRDDNWIDVGLSDSPGVLTRTNAKAIGTARSGFFHCRDRSPLDRFRGQDTFACSD